jgi:hypothetical protein
MAQDHCRSLRSISSFQMGGGHNDNNRINGAIEATRATVNNQPAELLQQRLSLRRALYLRMEPVSTEDCVSQYTKSNNNINSLHLAIKTHHKMLCTQTQQQQPSWRTMVNRTENHHLCKQRRHIVPLSIVGTEDHCRLSTIKGHSFRC